MLLPLDCGHPLRGVRGHQRVPGRRLQLRVHDFVRVGALGTAALAVGAHREFAAEHLAVELQGLAGGVGEVQVGVQAGRHGCLLGAVDGQPSEVNGGRQQRSERPGCRPGPVKQPSPPGRGRHWV